MRVPPRGYSARRRLIRLSPAGITAAVLLLAVGALWMTGVIGLATFGLGPKEPSTRGLVPIPTSAATIPAYSRVNRDHLWNAKAGAFSMIYLRPDQVPPEVLRSTSQIVGRVLDHEKPPGYAFTESDFLPQGTRPGLVAGIPAGKRALRVEADRIHGLFGLRPGDRFDLVSTLTIDAGRGAGVPAAGVYSLQLELQARMTNWQKQATVRVLVQSGSIVEPVQTRNVPVASNTMTQGMVVRARPVQEVVIAVAPGEVASLTEAMAVGAEISCVPRSGRPDDPRDSITPESRPWNPFLGGLPPARGFSDSSPLGPGPLSTIESISGTKREMIAAPIKR